METFVLRDVSFSYPQQARQALSGISLSVEQGEFLVLCGPSGGGKSTLLRLLKPELSPHGRRAGDIRFRGRPLDDLDRRSCAEKIGFVQQNPENQLVTDKVWHELAFGLESLGYETPVIRRRVSEMASFFGIQNWFYRGVSELSGGQKQLLNLASVMAMQPEVLLLDEPTSRLDPIAAADFLAALGRINRELGTTVILSEHRLDEALPLASRAAVLEGGRILHSGPPASLGSALRQRSDLLCAMPERHTAQPEPLPDAPVEPAQPLLTCSLQKPEQLTQALADCRPEMIYLPVEWLDTLDVTPYLDRTSFCAVLPRIFRTEDEAALREMLVRHRQVLAAVAVGNLGHLPIAEGLELPLRGDLGMNVFNSRALLFLRELGLSTAAVSFELRHQQIRDLKKYLPCEAVVYGRLPLMLMENCVIANSLGCCDVGSDYRKRSAACRCTGENDLTDRTGACFPLMPAWGHRNELENSRTLFLADKPEWRRLGLTYARLRFTTESPAECVAALRRYQGQGDYIPADLTRGLFYRGVE